MKHVFVAGLVTGDFDFFVSLYQFLIIFTDLYRMCNDPAHENDAFQMHNNFSQVLLKDHYQSSEMAEHCLINWTEGNLPNLSSDNSIKSSPLM